MQFFAEASECFHEECEDFGYIIIDEILAGIYDRILKLLEE